MGGLSIWHWLIVAGIVILLFGGGRISNVMGDMAKGVKAFKKGLEDDPPPPAPPKEIGTEGAEPVPAAKKDEAAHH